MTKDCTINSHHTNLFAHYLDQFGRVLTKPMSRLFLEEMTKVFRPLELGSNGQAKTLCGEIALRACRFVLGLLLLPAVAFGAVGGILRTIASQWRGKFVLIRPERAPAEEQIQNLTICTFNASMMPSFINLFFRGFSPARDRVQAAVKGALDANADVLCVQEAFNTEVVDEFAELIKTKYPYVIYNAGFKSLGLSSGLLIASRFPIENPQFWEHSQKLGSEHVGSKGAMAVKIVPNQNQRIPIFNTHLEAGVYMGNRDEVMNCKVAQLTQIQTHANRYRQGHAIAFLCGDMNIQSHFPYNMADYKKLDELITVTQCEAQKAGTLFYELPKVHKTKPCQCLDSQMSQGAIDHIGLLKPVTQGQFLEGRRDCFFGSSDHLAWIAKFSLVDS